MSRQILLYVLLVLSVFIAILHHVAIQYYFYWIFWWYDIIVHFLGGLFVGLGVLWIVFFSGVTKIHYSHKRAFFITIASILFVGSAWEIFELWAGVPFNNNYALDTVTDMIMDILGALSGYFYITFYHELKNR